MASEEFNAYWAAKYTELRRAFTSRFPIDYKNLGAFKERVFRVVDDLTAELKVTKEDLALAVGNYHTHAQINQDQQAEIKRLNNICYGCKKQESNNDPHQNS